MSHAESSTSAPSVVMCWELGGGLGHTVKAALLARELLERGCEVSFAVRELASAHKLLPEDSYCLVQAPVVATILQDWPPPADYAELLLHAGWGQTSELQGRVRGWRGLFDALHADLVIADHAPTALLAARTQGIPTALWGHGFGVPSSPWPIFRTWEQVPASRLAQVHQHVFNTVNSVLGSFATSPMSQLEDLFDMPDNFLCTWPELDHYPNRQADSYCGPIWPAKVGEAARWGAPARAGLPKVFAYLRPNLPGLADILQALAGLDAIVLAHVSDHARLAESLRTLPKISFTDRLIDMEDVACQASLVVCSGTDTLHGMAVRGVPTLSLPMNAEQRMGAERLVTEGVGLCVIPEAGQADFQSRIADATRKLLLDPCYRTKAAILRARHVGHDSAASLATIADRCLNLARDGIDTSL